MIYAKAGDAAMVYTGDYNMTADRHLGAAQIDRLKLDLLITEYGPTSNYKHDFSFQLLAFTQILTKCFELCCITSIGSFLCIRTNAPQGQGVMFLFDFRCVIAYVDIRPQEHVPDW